MTRDRRASGDRLPYRLGDRLEDHSGMAFRAATPIAFRREVPEGVIKGSGEGESRNTPFVVARRWF